MFLYNIDMGELSETILVVMQKCNASLQTIIIT